MQLINNIKIIVIVLSLTIFSASVVKSTEECFEKTSRAIFKFNFKKKIPCFRCFMPEKPVAENNCQSDGIFSPVAGILGSLQANEVLKTILGIKTDLNNKMIIFDSIKSNFRNVKITRNPKCVNKCSN